MREPRLSTVLQTNLTLQEKGNGFKYRLLGLGITLTSMGRCAIVWYPADAHWATFPPSRAGQTRLLVVSGLVLRRFQTEIYLCWVSKETGKLSNYFSFLLLRFMSILWHVHSLDVNKAPFAITYCVQLLS
jgi:hypothetical protein